VTRSDPKATPTSLLPTPGEKGSKRGAGSLGIPAALPGSWLTTPPKLPVEARLGKQSGRGWAVTIPNIPTAKAWQLHPVVRRFYLGRP
jgi:hypothetical protein